MKLFRDDRWAAVSACVLSLALPSAALVATSAPTRAAMSAPAGIVLNERGYGWVLTDSKGMSLYTTVKDQQPGKSECFGPCAEMWPPVIAPADAKPSDEWSLIDRGSGVMQWAFDGHPLYRYSRDLSPSDSYGNDVDGEWEVATKFIDRPVSVAVARTLLGHVLVDARTGTTLYHFAEDEPGNAVCAADCTRNWIPQKAPFVAVAKGDWTIFERGDGIRQWAYKGKPAYRYAGDLAPGDARGHEAEFAKWQAFILEPLPPLPSWVTVQASDAGLILADSAGRTLYGRTLARLRGQNLGLAASQSVRPGYEMPGAGRTTDCVECPRSYWSPVLAKAGDKSFGNWSIVKRGDGKLHWAFKGEPLYTHARDTWRGALNGVRSGDRSWHALMRSGQQMQGTGN